MRIGCGGPSVIVAKDDGQLVTPKKQQQKNKQDEAEPPGGGIPAGHHSPQTAAAPCSPAGSDSPITYQPGPPNYRAIDPLWQPRIDHYYRGYDPYYEPFMRRDSPYPYHDETPPYSPTSPSYHPGHSPAAARNRGEEAQDGEAPLPASWQLQNNNRHARHDFEGDDSDGDVGDAADEGYADGGEGYADDDGDNIGVQDDAEEDEPAPKRVRRAAAGEEGDWEADGGMMEAAPHYGYYGDEADPPEQYQHDEQEEQAGHELQDHIAGDDDDEAPYDPMQDYGYNRDSNQQQDYDSDGVADDDDSKLEEAQEEEEAEEEEAEADDEPHRSPPHTQTSPGGVYTDDDGDDDDDY